ncbi:hypothetical protein AWB92_03650 [Mycobacterium sp. IEC1808]|uniref:hypothetical protein n=1 Tax=Mycobacterium sp. IEC1808 TaxID=1743230 RepID=UPI000A15D3C5|nr:hypothetical protein [Mycobacterium sp. IEC1808]ORW96983.1 hypothetical protein AWB92_03650 [Mycobacterium sp. IEC1808]
MLVVIEEPKFAAYQGHIGETPLIEHGSLTMSFDTRDGEHGTLQLSAAECRVLLPHIQRLITST